MDRTRRWILLMGLLALGSPFLRAQKGAEASIDQPRLHYPLFHIKTDLLGLILDQPGFELEVRLDPRWAFSMRYASRQAQSDLLSPVRSPCLISRGEGLALGSRVQLQGDATSGGWSLRGTLFIHRREDQRWACRSPGIPLREGREWGLNSTLHYVWPLGGSPFFLEGFGGIGARQSSFTYLNSLPTPESGWRWQLPVGVMLGLRL